MTFDQVLTFVSFYILLQYIRTQTVSARLMVPTTTKTDFHCSRRNPSSAAADKEGINWNDLIPTELTVCSVIHFIFQPNPYTQEVVASFKDQDSFIQTSPYKFMSDEKGESTSLRNIKDLHKLRKSSCILALVQFITVEEILNLYEVLNDLQNVITKDDDYFIFYSSKKPEHFQELLGMFRNGPIAFGIKNKFGIHLSSSSSESEFKISQCVASCPVCNGGEPGLRTLEENKDVLFPDNLRNFAGKNFKVGYAATAVSVIEAKEIRPGEWKGTRGYFISIAEHLSEKFNFTMKLRPAMGGGGPGIPLKNGTWVGTVGDIVNGVSEFCLVSGHAFGRHKFVGWSRWVWVEWLTFTTSLPQKEMTWKSITWSFTFQVWIYLVLVTFLSYGTLLFLLKVSGHKSVLPRETGMFLFRTLLEQDSNNLEGKSSKKINAIRVFIAFWFIFCMHITNAYRSKLITFMAFPQFTQPPESFKDLSETTPGEFEIVLAYVGGAAYKMFKTSKNPIFKKIFGRLEVEKDLAKCLLRTIGNPKFACIAWQSVARYSKYRKFSDVGGKGKVPYLQSKDTSSFLGISIIFQKQAVFRRKFDEIIGRAYDLGMVFKWLAMDDQFLRRERIREKKKKAKELADTSSSSNNEVAAGVAPDDTISVNIEQLKGPFGLLGIGVVLGMISFFVEVAKKGYTVLVGKTSKFLKTIAI